ncbi:hypothetical protein QEH59_12200 [Coraliomargarita sp. SDUM461004]|uniref:Uncharacterized protein n=1 Tax=Thalassobacterium sedimentorum TaxID=3041258 RepID=A0ABU1AK50_9BACT|nr:hypothetical protein [Coraliomargarita sp. SDUM461004]MDQ8195192.1 hypothetical protein [Coraliomargarita sp. SDUM461004]
MPTGNIQSNQRSKPARQLVSPFLRISLLLGVCVHLAGFLVFRVISNPIPTREEQRPFVQYVSPDTLLSGAELEEQVALFDSAPLFVPGIWNAAHNLQPPSRDQGLLRFPAYEPSIDFSTALVADGLQDGLNYPVSEPIDLLALRYWDLFRDFGKEAVVPQKLQVSGAFAEVRTLAGAVLCTVPFELEQLSSQTLQPASYYLRVEASGRMLGRPTLAASSGDTSFDASAYTWLLEEGFSVRLPAGFFEVRVYP